MSINNQTTNAGGVSGVWGSGIDLSLSFSGFSGFSGFPKTISRQISLLETWASQKGIIKINSEEILPEDVKKLICDSFINEYTENEAERDILNNWVIYTIKNPPNEFRVSVGTIIVNDMFAALEDCLRSGTIMPDFGIDIDMNQRAIFSMMWLKNLVKHDSGFQTWYDVKKITEKGIETSGINLDI